jgi:hypothetical protein
MLTEHDKNKTTRGFFMMFKSLLFSALLSSTVAHAARMVSCTFPGYVLTAQVQPGAGFKIAYLMLADEEHQGQTVAPAGALKEPVAYAGKPGFVWTTTYGNYEVKYRYDIGLVSGWSHATINREFAARLDISWPVYQSAPGKQSISGTCQLYDHP